MAASEEPHLPGGEDGEGPHMLGGDDGEDPHLLGGDEGEESHLLGGDKGGKDELGGTEERLKKIGKKRQRLVVVERKRRKLEEKNTRKMEKSRLKKELKKIRSAAKMSQRIGSPSTPMNLLRSPIGTLARVATMKRARSPTTMTGSPPQAKRTKSQIFNHSRAGPSSPSQVTPCCTITFPSPMTHSRGSTRKPRKLKSEIWKEFEPIYENGKIVQGRCTHCHETIPASRSSGTDHIRRHLRVCETRNRMHEMVASMHSSALSPDVALLKKWTFDQEVSRRELVRMIVLHELSFSLVEYDGFRKFVGTLNPMFKMVSRTTIKSDCMSSYKDHSLSLREFFKNLDARVSLTADMWTSNQKLGYLCVTCHFIDTEWKIQKRIIRFCLMETPYDSLRMYNVLVKSIQYWNIEDKIFSFTLDNASVNASMIGHLKDNLLVKNMLNCEGKLFHICCAAHVLNLIVQDGLKAMEGVIDSVRDSVKYIKSSQSRKERFEEIIEQVGVTCEKRPSLDVSSRWNLTFLMIESALPFRAAFDDLGIQDPQFICAPTHEEWLMAETICNLLRAFYNATEVVLGSTYPTSNRYFHEVWNVKQLLDKEASNQNRVVACMVKEMQEKWDKYWKESCLTNCVPVIFDPRFKFGFIEFRLRQAFGYAAEALLADVDEVIRKLFEDYCRQMGYTPGGNNVDIVAENDPLADWEAHLNVQRNQERNELDRYSKEELFPRQESFNILQFWAIHAPKYPILSRMARYLLAIPASTVASESAFSTGGRVISDHRSRLTSDTVEALLCLQDWLRASGSSTIHLGNED